MWRNKSSVSISETCFHTLKHKSFLHKTENCYSVFIFLSNLWPKFYLLITQDQPTNALINYRSFFNRFMNYLSYVELCCESFLLQTCTINYLRLSKNLINWHVCYWQRNKRLCSDLSLSSSKQALCRKIIKLTTPMMPFSESVRTLQTCQLSPTLSTPTQNMICKLFSNKLVLGILPCRLPFCCLH